jgi:DNA repair protein RecO (recombination protein O)
MEWTDEGIVVAARRHGEHAAIVALLTREHGRHLGLVRGGAGGRHGSTYQPGNLVRARWRARLEEHLGTYVCEPVAGYAAAVMDDPLRLAALASVTAIVELACPEREPHPRLFESTLALLEGLDRPSWAQRYVAWERACLGDLGFGLDLAACAATGRRDDLGYVSPRTGRAVSRAAGAPYADRLLRLPEFLAGDAAAEASADDILTGLDLTGFFLERHVLSPQQRHLPPARKRFVDRWRRHAFARDTNARLP